MSNIDSKLRPLVDQFVRDLEAAFRRSALEAVQSSLAAFAAGAAPKAASTVKRGPGRPPKAKAAPHAPKSAPNASKSSASKPSKKPRAAKKSGIGGRRSPAEIEATAAKILAYIKSHPGTRGEVIKKALGLDKAHWLVPINRLVDEKKVSMKGQRRATTYTAS